MDADIHVAAVDHERMRLILRYHGEDFPLQEHYSFRRGETIRPGDSGTCVQDQAGAVGKIQRTGLGSRDRHFLPEDRRLHGAASAAKEPCGRQHHEHEQRRGGRKTESGTDPPGRNPAVKFREHIPVVGGGLDAAVVKMGVQLRKQRGVVPMVRKI